MLRFIALINVILLSNSVIGQVRLKEDFSTATNNTPPTGWETSLVKGKPSDEWSYIDPYSVSPLASASRGILQPSQVSFILMMAEKKMWN